MKHLLTTLVLIVAPIFSFVFAAPVLSPSVVSAHHCIGDDPSVNHPGGSIEECIDAGACLNTSGAGCQSQEGATNKLNDTVKLVINMISILVGVVAVIMIIIGGLKYIMSSGDNNNIQSAKNTILYAIIGLVVVAVAQIIVRFVLAKTT